MLTFLVVLIVLGMAGIVSWTILNPAPMKKKVEKVLDTNKDGVVNKQDAVKVAENVKAEVGRAKRKYGGKVKKAAKTVK